MTNTMIKMVRFHETGDAKVLQLDEMLPRKPQAGEVRIHVEAIGLNRAEIMFRRGEYLESPNLPSKIGYEAAGKVDALGEGVENFNIGDRVSTIPSFAMGDYGVYGESAVVPAYAVAHYPEHLTATQGASIWMQYITAYGALIHLSQLNAEQTILITAASSSVGLAAIQIAKLVGAKVIATTRSVTKRPFLLDAGADYVVVTDEQDMIDSVMAITSDKGVDVIFDPIVGPMLELFASCAAEGGKIIEYGALSNQPATFPLFEALAKGLEIRGYTLFEIVKDTAALVDAKKFVLEGLNSKKLIPFIDRTFSLEQIVEAHEYMESNQQIGKIIVTV